MKEKIRSILQSHLLALGEYNTAWEGVKNNPPLPYQSVWLAISASHTGSIAEHPRAVDVGFLQITLYAEIGKGTQAIESRATQLRRHFYGQSIITDDVQLVIHTPPVIGGIVLQDNKLALPVTINFEAYEL
ncbi:phage tail terminator-like protein [Lonepinella sp. BR2930]|uniref:phage tail terminator-like protein n=1 Tax=Lonepinella sp. BR2930 TaxID=3434554 RepID=UPI003F6E1B32